MSTSRRITTETFLGRDDAYNWFDNTIREEVNGEWVLEEASIRYINLAWVAAVMTGKRQGELILD